MKQTMRQHSFTSRLKSLAVVFGMALAFASCANEDVVQNPTKSNEDNDKNLTTFMAGGETRTSLDYSGNFYWGIHDYIYVIDDDGILQKSWDAPKKSKVAAFKYKVPGKFTANTSYKVYYLGKYSDGSSVTISTAQSQIVPDSTDFGTAGDYGTATATGTLGGGSFSFELEHQPAYLVFLPYTSNTILKKCYLTKIEVISDNDIAETYTFNPTTGALDASPVTNGNKIVLTTKGILGSNYVKGFPLTNSTASVTTNGAYMVIKPGTHTLKVRYWVRDEVSNVEGAITKILPSTTYASNTYYDMTANLDVRDYDGDHYYSWDAQQQYWYGYEWTKHLPGNTGQPTLKGNRSSNYAQSSADPRYYNGSYLGYRVSNPAIHSCKDLPNANELSWYCMYGEPHWDADELWTTMGHLYKGGMWFKKKSVLQSEHHYDTEKSADGITDLRTMDKDYENSSINSGPPSAADANNYFYLPALGYYYEEELQSIGPYGVGCYWSSSANPTYSTYAYDLRFSGSDVEVGSHVRRIGSRVEPTFK